jgi:protein O-GlcNAc transferase
MSDTPLSIPDAYRLAVTLHQENRLTEAEEVYRLILGAYPDHPEVNHSLGYLALQMRAPEAGLPHLRIALHANPDEPRYRATYGKALVATALEWRKQRRSDGAIALCAEAVDMCPDDGEFHFELGCLLEEAERFTEAAEHYAEADRLCPDHHPAILNLAYSHYTAGRMDEALATLRRADALSPMAQHHSAILMFMNLLPIADNDALYREIRVWRARYGRSHAPDIRFANDRDPERQLRIGFVSNLLGMIDEPPTTLWLSMLPIVENYDPERTELYIYGDRFDRSRLAPVWDLPTAWRETGDLDDEACAALIRSDGIDILVSIIGHSSRDRMTLFTWRPAPIQASHCALITSGIEDMDYFILDDCMHPPDSSERIDESPAYLPHFFALKPMEWAPAVAPLPAVKLGGRITFGCFNVRNKLSGPALSCFARILKAVPESRLLLKCRSNGYATSAARDSMRQALASHGIAPERIEFLPLVESSVEHLDSYRHIDFALDTFPFQGCLTTYDALWMGVPTVSLNGERIAHRAGQALLHAVGLDDWIVRTEDEYIAKVTAMVADLDSLAELRKTLRQRVRASPLCDGAGFTQGLEDLFRDMWRTWCARPSS